MTLPCKSTHNAKYLIHDDVWLMIPGFKLLHVCKKMGGEFS